MAKVGGLCVEKGMIGQLKCFAIGNHVKTVKTLNKKLSLKAEKLATKLDQKKEKNPSSTLTFH